MSAIILEISHSFLKRGKGEEAAENVRKEALLIDSPIYPLIIFLRHSFCYVYTHHLSPLVEYKAGIQTVGSQEVSHPGTGQFSFSMLQFQVPSDYAVGHSTVHITLSCLGVAGGRERQHTNPEKKYMDR